MLCGKLPSWRAAIISADSWILLPSFCRGSSIQGSTRSVDSVAAVLNGDKRMPEDDDDCDFIGLWRVITMTLSIGVERVVRLWSWNEWEFWNWRGTWTVGS